MVTLRDMQEQLAKMPTITGKQASTYICGPNTYADILIWFGVKRENYRPSGMHMMGVHVYVSQYAPDNGKLYPADYLESRQCR